MQACLNPFYTPSVSSFPLFMISRGSTKLADVWELIHLWKDGFLSSALRFSKLLFFTHFLLGIFQRMLMPVLKMTFNITFFVVQAFLTTYQAHR